MPTEKREFDGINGMVTENTNSLLSSLISPNLFDNTQNTFKTFTQLTAKTSERMLWGVGKFLLSQGQSVNFLWDVALNAILNLLKTGGDAHHAVTTKISNVPILGYGASGIDEVIKTSLDVIERNVKNDIEARKNAFASLNHKIVDSGARLSHQTSYPTNNKNNHGQCVPAVEADSQTSTVAAATAAKEPSTESNGYVKEVMKCGKEVATAAEEALKASGRVIVSTLGMFVLALKGLSATTAATGENLARGYQTVNKITGDIPVIGTVTTGLEHLIVGATNTYSDNSHFNTERRKQMVDDLRTHLNQFKPGEQFGGSDKDAAAAATAAASDDKPPAAE